MRVFTFATKAVFVGLSVLLVSIGHAEVSCTISKSTLVPPPSEDPYIENTLGSLKTDKFGSASSEFDGFTVQVDFNSENNAGEITVTRKATDEEQKKLNQGAFWMEPPTTVVVASTNVSFNGPLKQAILSFGDYTVICQ